MNDYELPLWHKNWVIVLAFIFCWPVGIFLLIGRVNSSKKSMFDGSKTTKVCLIVGVILILIGLSSFSGKKILAGLFYIAGGIALIYYAQQNKKKVARYKSYVELVANQKVYSLDTISNTMNVTYDVAHDEIQKLISLGSFRGATINELTRSIDIAPVQQIQTNVSYGVQQMNNDATGGMVSMVSKQAATITATCPGCGGTAVAQKGATVECDYCGKIFTAN